MIISMTIVLCNGVDPSLTNSSSVWPMVVVDGLNIPLLCVPVPIVQIEKYFSFAQSLIQFFRFIINS